MKRVLLIFFILLINIKGHLFTTAQALKTTPMMATKVDIPKTLAVKIYPNPASDQITINYKENALLQKIELYNVLGRLIEDFPVQSPTSTTLSVDKFPAGLYLLKLNGKHQKKTIRVKKV